MAARRLFRHECVYDEANMKKRELHRRAAVILEKHPDIDFDVLQKKYWKWNVGATLTLVFFSFLLAAIYTLSFSRLASAIHSDGSCVHLILPSVFVWLLHGFFLGMITAAGAIYFLLKYLLGPNRYNEFELFV